mgnify:FL=1
MGLWSLIRSVKRRKQIDAAADQLYAALCRSAGGIEIPQSLNKDDPVAAAVVRLREKYPSVVVSMLQSKSIVLQRGSASKASVSNQAWSVLDAHGYFPSNELPLEVLFAQHEHFMVRNKVDPRDAAKAAEEERLNDTQGVVLNG